MSNLITIQTPEQREAEAQAFREKRRSGIGGSDVHHLFNLEPYGCARRLFYQKSGVAPDYLPKNVALFERGHVLEPIIVTEYLRKTGRSGELHKETIYSERCPEMFVHLDYLIYNEAGVAGVLEAKSAGREVFAKIKREGIPAGYALQLQDQMHVSGLTWGAFAVLWPDGWDMLRFDVEYDVEIGQMIEHEARKFWVRVQTGDAPDRLKPSDKRCKSCEYRTSCQGAAMLEGVQDSDAKDLPFLDISLEEYLNWKAIAEEANAFLDAAKDQIREAMGVNAAADVPGARVYFRPSERRTIDGKRLAEQYERLLRVANTMSPGSFGDFKPVEEFTNTAVVRALRIYER